MHLLGLIAATVGHLAGGWIGSPILWIIVGGPLVLGILGTAAAKIRGSR